MTTTQERERRLRLKEGKLLLRERNRLLAQELRRRKFEVREDIKEEKRKKKRFVDPYKLAEKVRKDYETRKEYAITKKEIRKLEAQERYKRTRTGKVGGFITKAFGVGRRGVASSLYARHQPKVSSVKGVVKTGRRGRPVGSVKYVHPRTGQPIGVYEYRKLLAQELRERRLQSIRQSSVTPRQEQVLRQMQIQQMQQRMNPERKVIPDTSGEIPMKHIMEEINISANLVD